MFWILLGAGLLLLIYFYLLKPCCYWEKHGVPQDKFWTVWLELFESLMQHKNIADALQDVYKRFPNSRYYGIYQFLTPTLAIRDPDLIKQIVVKDFDHFVDHFNFLANESDPLWQKNLFILKGDEWRNMRTTLSPSFTSSKMKIIFNLMSECAKQFVQYFEKQEQGTITVELRDIFTRFTNDVIATAAFGVTCDSMSNKENQFYMMGKKGTQFGGGLWDNVKFFFGLMFPKLSKTLGVRILKQDVSEFFMNVIKSNIHSRDKEGIIRPDMIHLLLEARRERSKNDKPVEGSKDVNQPEIEHFTDEDIAAQAFIFFLAGFDTVATLMYFIAYELALSPDTQQRLIDEIDDIRNECGDSLQYEDLSRMKYMDMVISETLRKWPGAIVLDRVCVKPYTIQPTKTGEKPIHLKEGDLVWFPVFAMHRDPQFYSEPDRFDPERFNEENKASVNPYTYLPFGAGPRVCIGTRFALMETKLVFFYLLSKFEFTVIEKTPIPLKLNPQLFQLDALGGFWMGLKPRKEVQ